MALPHDLETAPVLPIVSGSEVDLLPLELAELEDDVKTVTGVRGVGLPEAGVALHVPVVPAPPPGTNGRERLCVVRLLRCVMRVTKEAGGSIGAGPEPLEPFDPAGVIAAWLAIAGTDGHTPDVARGDNPTPRTSALTSPPRAMRSWTALSPAGCETTRCSPTCLFEETPDEKPASGLSGLRLARVRRFGGVRSCPQAGVVGAAPGRRSPISGASPDEAAVAEIRGTCSTLGISPGRSGSPGATQESMPLPGYSAESAPHEETRQYSPNQIGHHFYR